MFLFTLLSGEKYYKRTGSKPIPISYTKANTQMNSNNYSYYCILSYPLRYLQDTDIIWLHFLHIIFMSG